MTTAVDEQTRAVEEELDAEYAGVGWWGSLYRAPRRRRWFRLIPNEEISGEQRSELVAWQTRPRRRELVPVVRGEGGEQRQFGGRWFQVVSYETDARRGLADALDSADPALRVAAVAAVLRAYPGWREAVGPGLVALPADIVLATDRGPLLLPLPPWGAPSLEQLAGAPTRIAHLTPEAARGLAPRDRDPGLHALAVAARTCFENLPDGDTDRLLQRAACAAVFTDGQREGRLPSWMRRVEPVRGVRERLRDLTGPRASRWSDTEAERLADALDEARRAMDPVAAVEALHKAGSPRLAVGLAHAALVDRPSYDLLILAARIARQDLKEPLEALSLLERAVQADPGRSEAYAAQLSIIGGLWPVVQGGLAQATDGSFAQRLNDTARAAFQRLPAEQQRDHAHEMAGCLIGQGAYAEANVHVHTWLHDSANTLMWWRLDLMLDYAETFLRLGRRADARQVLDQVKAGLRRLRENGQMNASEIHEHGMRLAELERRLLEGDE
ncbi:hypothetical protein ACOT81_43625 [Streptomyces sp. WI04-05B]|uniref:hypothetical protein n=1 Tax=Streptomyces TaxID=1883 RepID=UPI0029AAEFF3|nr:MULTISPECIES: hypothetical protein [unclassified Streptomyces]MDX2543292.1 hypothetical protein [Streptomyces sp. WI04-05B]MDX2586694.1 hypothetical protein [Streptomyces sp. WI04-05A]MDX3748400.1 hypothetical protein [Streptomyces sp. AK08-02]